MADRVTVLIAGAGPVRTHHGHRVEALWRQTAHHGQIGVAHRQIESTRLVEPLAGTDPTLGFRRALLGSRHATHGARISNGTDLIGEITLDDVKSRYPLCPDDPAKRH